MERQLKERLIGAAVLVAVAVVMVPEMFSGPHSHSGPSADASTSSGQIKTYHIELQSAHSAEAAAPVAVEAPAAQPRDEAPVSMSGSAPATNSVVSTSSASVSSVSASIASSSTPRSDTEPATVVAKPAAKPASTPEQAPNRTVPVVKPAEGDWTVQVGSFATQDKARQIVGKLKEQGYPAYLGKVTVAGKTLYRVRVGAAPVRATAESTLQKLKATYPGASVVPANR